jgi:hypothetical protein
MTSSMSSRMPTDDATVPRANVIAPATAIVNDHGCRDTNPINNSRAVRTRLTVFTALFYQNDADP